MVGGVIVAVDDELPPRVAATTPPATAAPAIARMVISLAEMPAETAPAAALTAFVWLMVVLAVCPWCEAVTWI